MNSDPSDRSSQNTLPPHRPEQQTLLQLSDAPPSAQVDHYRTEAFGTVYLLKSPILGAYKVGLTNSRNRRVGEHLANGWKPVKSWTFSDGRVALDVETTALRTLRRFHDGGFLGPREMPQGGWTETFPCAALDDRYVVHVIEETVTDVAGPQRQLELSLG